jgi:putative flippase GtrA
MLIRLADKATRSDRFRLIRYFVAGLAVSLGYTFTIVALVDWLGLVSAEAANAISLIIWTLISYVVHREFTFRFDGSHGGTVARFIFVFTLKFIASVIVIALAMRHYQSSYLVGVAVNWVVLPLVSYFAMKLWVFARAHPIGSGARLVSNTSLGAGETEEPTANGV